ncbi:DUF459 domain-containing protein [Rhizobiaceae bacterium n13]|uniref:DUF459 domain-containing protein n=1 Tax=Ferirhizobium litorale TaxID=2927786 RepID=A0AAE3Q7G5_9HYPH|nr:DUF459 domain-containing protein [Fererhizobium litorale]MDI7860512.1 DUF459 domain-containing protein [Fererhizobium litorale]MDI7920647.1 DUF459 domain-containing protein [Fererhizobium litorale]
MKNAIAPIWKLAATTLTVLVAIGFAVPVISTPASAQQRRVERLTILEMLFGKRQRRPVDVYPNRPTRTAKPRAAKPRKRSAAPVETVKKKQAPPPVAKLDNAKKVLVVGDFFAGGLGDGLQVAFETSPGVVIETRSNVASGLVRSDYYDWQTQLPKFLDETVPAVVVVMLGANDRQQMAVNGSKEKFRTENWFKEYEARALALGKQVADRKIPLLWVGLPAFESPSMTADAVQLNGLLKSQVEKVGGEFIDIWDGFVDEDGRFVITGSDINGQQVRLRGSDGINMTKAGKRKVAFYVEKPVRRLLGDMASPDLIKLDAESLPDLVKLPPGEVKDMSRTPPINLSDPALDGGTELMGARAAPVLLAKTARDKLLEDGEMPPPPAGRVDNYAMPSSTTATSR